MPYSETTENAILSDQYDLQIAVLLFDPANNHAELHDDERELVLVDRITTLRLWVPVCAQWRSYWITLASRHQRHCSLKTDHSVRPPSKKSKKFVLPFVNYLNQRKFRLQFIATCSAS